MVALYFATQPYSTFDFLAIDKILRKNVTFRAVYHTIKAKIILMNDSSLTTK